jgi:hypothetical protein
MSHAPIEKVHEKQTGTVSIFQELKERIRQRVFRNFEGCHAGAGHTTEDPTGAERDLLWR